MGFEPKMEMPEVQPTSKQEKPANDLGLTKAEQAFMDKGNMTPAQYENFKRLRALAEEMGVDLAA